MIVIVIGNAAMGTIRRRIKAPLVAAWRSRPILTSLGMGVIGCVPLALWGWHHTLSLVILGSSFLRRPIFWLGDHLFDRWTKPLHYQVRKAIHRNRVLRATLRYPRAGLAAIYGAFETVRERRLTASIRLRRPCDTPTISPTPVVARDQAKRRADRRPAD
jgi:hypothetical protein